MSVTRKSMIIPVAGLAVLSMLLLGKSLDKNPAASAALDKAPSVQAQSASVSGAYATNDSSAGEAALLLSAAVPAPPPGMDVLNPAPLLDNQYFPFQSLEKDDLQAALGPHISRTASDLLSPDLVENLEDIVFAELDWMLEANFDSYVSMNRRISPDNTEPCSPAGAESQYLQLYHCPVERLGFADAPIEVVRADLGSVLPENLQRVPRFQKLAGELGEDALLVKVSFAIKNSEGAYKKVEAHYYFDEQRSMFRPLRMRQQTLENPVLDVPLSLRGLDQA